MLDNFEKLPNSRLGKLKSFIDDYQQKTHKKFDSDVLLDICDDYDLTSYTFYYNRDPYVLNSILNYLNGETLHLDERFCTRFFADELAYWEVDEALLKDCCCEKYYTINDEMDEKLKYAEEIIKNHNIKDDFGNVLPTVREKIWNILEQKDSESLLSIVRVKHSIKVHIYTVHFIIVVHIFILKKTLLVRYACHYSN